MPPRAQILPTPALLLPAAARGPGRGAALASALRRHSLHVTAGDYRSYSVDKFQALDVYCRDTPCWRIALVILATPLPGLVTAVVPALLPLQAPHLGYNFAFFCHAAFVDFSCAVGILVIWLAVTNVPRSVYSLREVVAVSAVNVALHVPLLYAAVRYWRYPIPFAWVLFAGVFLVTLALAHVLVLRTKLWHDRAFATAARVYAGCMLFQSAQILFYPAFTVLFDSVSDAARVRLSLAFPLVKFVLKRSLQRLARRLDPDHATEVDVCGVEICASLYQSTILQVAPSQLAIACIVGLDMVQGAATVAWYLDRHARVRVATLAGKRLLDAARFLLTRHTVAVAVADGPMVSAISPMVSAISPCPSKEKEHAAEEHDDTTLVSLRGHRNVHRDVAVTRREKEQILEHALDVARLAEEVLLVEYLEVVVPLLHALFLVLTARLPTAQFNQRLKSFYDATDTTLLLRAVASIMLYTLLQAVSLVVLHVVLQRRYGLSGVRQLAFVLERHRLAIVGKLMVWPPFILHFTLAQYGVDFSFQFDTTKTA